jgi:apolipoprotein D and lipocalin family protein
MQTKKIIAIIIIVIVVAFLGVNYHPSQDLNTVTIDPVRYSGLWHSVKEIPSYLGFYPFGYDSKTFTNETAFYTLNNDGTIKVVNTAYINGTANVIEGTAKIVGDGKLEVSFFPLVWAPYQIIGIDTNYQWAVVGSPNHNNLWYLSRATTLTTEQLIQMDQIALSNGFDVTKLMVVK